MKTPFRWMACAVMMVATGLYAGDFSKSLTPEEFAGAGLGKLTPDELARLDALVSGRHTAEIAHVRAETTAKVRAETTAQVKAEVAAAKPAESTSLLHRMRVVLTPGAEIAYEKVETQLVGPYRGYDPGTVLKLANGQEWRVVEGSYWVSAKEANKPRKVTIEPGVLGSFYLAIENGGRPKVKIVGGAH
jgi:hypothetical protein